MKAKFIVLKRSTLIKLKEGDHSAFISVYDAYHKGLYTFVRKYIFDEQIAEDITHDVFMKLWETKSRVDPERPLINYLYRITRNTVYKELKKIQTIKSSMDRLGLCASSNREDAVDISYQHKEYERILENAVSRLPTQRQRVFILCRQQGKTYEEAAQQLSISSHTVKEHMSLAIRDIKDYICKNTDLVFDLMVILGLASSQMLFF